MNSLPMAITMNWLPMVLTINRCDIYPTDPVIGCILLLSLVYNAPRFFEYTIDYREDYSLARINDTGNPLVDQQLVKVGG